MSIPSRQFAVDEGGTSLGTRNRRREGAYRRHQRDGRRGLWGAMRRADVDQWIEKPFGQQTLLAALERWVPADFAEVVR